MNKWHNLGTVVKFEIIRTLKKKSFWAMALGFPLMLIALYGVMFWSNQATVDAAKKLQEQKFSIKITDESKLIRPELLKTIKAEQAADKQSAITEVKSGKLDAYYYVPADLVNSKAEVYAKDTSIFENGKYGAVLMSLLENSVRGSVGEGELAVLQKKVASTTTTYKNGKEYNAIREMIVPGFFLILFYLMVAFFGNQMLTSTIEEKENRTVEMLLTTVRSTTLIVGKILGLVVLAIIQAAVIVVPMLVGYWAFGSNLNLPAVDLSQLSFDPVRISIAAAIFIASFMMFTGLLVMLGAMMPTAKEAGGWFGAVMMLIFGPLYGVTLFVSYPESAFSQFMSYCPLTAPIPLLLRNAVGNLQPHEALIAVILISLTAALIIWAAVKIFRYGAMSYDSKLSLSALRAKRLSSGK